VIGKIIDKLYSAIQTKVDGVIDSLGEKILNAIVKSIVGALFPGNTYKAADAATLAAQANTQATSISATQTASLQAAAQAANDPAGLEDELKAGAEEQSESSADEDNKDAAEEEALQRSDDDEDNCEAEESNDCDDSSQGTYVRAQVMSQWSGWVGSPPPGVGLDTPITCRVWGAACLACWL
jgi:TATA-binding protein-associated factor Taf7